MKKTFKVKAKVKKVIDKNKVEDSDIITPMSQPPRGSGGGSSGGGGGGWNPPTPDNP